jgi:AcrR family transcriptional regulator
MPESRRTPSQARSKEKYEQILRAATALIGERGNDSVSMREIAKHAGVALSSIYQYFPDKNAILAAIMQSYFQQIRQNLSEKVASWQNVEEAQQGIINTIDMFYALFKEEPVLATLWAGMQANKQLKDLDTEDTQINAKLLSEKLRDFYPQHSFEALHAAVTLLLHTAGMAVRIAMDLPEDKSLALMEELKTLATLRLQSL